MDKWLQFLAEQGARVDEANPGELGFVDSSTVTENFIAPLTDLGVLAFTGEEAAHFLHNQLTNDVERLGTGEARLAGYCSPKGRLLASFLMWKTDQAILLQMSRDILPAVQKRLQMFVLRAKVKIADVSGEYAILGMAGENVAEVLRDSVASAPDAPYGKLDTEAGSLIRLADADGKPRYQWIAPIDLAIKAWPQLSSRLGTAGPSRWRLTEIRAALPRIVAATQDQFVPQMVNFEVVGGVNFKKGCYPGQEIVARSQYLGKLKRRMMPAAIAADTTTDAVKPGMEVFSAADPEQPCGMVVNAERDGERTLLLVELKTAALAESLHLGSAQGPALTILSLPYALPDAS